ncbi:hypothetical protein ACFQY0_13395 [Haloferula chungangensis]|uniref:Uncharacterized protein n=1 Tax=Haloferula chungangensis TaxID=1048331 RepID=A0ABW2L928_9BACT
MIPLVASLLVVGFPSCSTDLGKDRQASSSESALKLGPFRQGNFIPDEKPLKAEDTTDLREVALSLPIWESSWKSSEEWVYMNSKDGRRVDQWTNPADGAQHAVTIKRLAKSSEGLTRVGVFHPSLKVFTPDGGRYGSWSAVLERRTGGWFVESVD